MSQQLKGFTINEGYTDFGTLTIGTCKVRNPIFPEGLPDNAPQMSRFCLFRILDEEEKPLPDGVKVVFAADFLGEEVEQEFITYTSHEGFVGFDAPVFPMVELTDEGDRLIKFKLEPHYESREEETYLGVLYASGGGPTETLYTLSGDVGVKDGYLGIHTVDEAFYRLAQEIQVGAHISALYIGTKGAVFAYDTEESEWVLLNTLEFTQMPYPEHMESVVEGVYRHNEESGPLNVGTLEEGGFDRFSLSVLNPTIYYFDANIKVYVEGSDEPIFEDKLENLLPGNQNYIPVVVEYSPPVFPDVSPTLDDIETISGLTFSSGFKVFLGTKGFTTLKTLAAAGPIEYLIGVPGLDEDDKKLQSYVNLYGVTENIEHVQRLVSIGYENIYDIANTPRSTFVADVIDEVNPVINIYRAGEIYYTSEQRKTLLSNIVATATLDYGMADAKFSGDELVVGESNSYGSYLSENYLSSCSCDDCKSSVSPFAYLTDLIKYAAAHITKTGVGAYSPTNFETFVVRLRNTFYQPYDTLPVTCDTLHQEFCRVRLVTEVLEKLVAATSGIISPARLGQLANDRKNYLQITYNTILTQAGTSLDEVRATFTAPDPDDKRERARKLAAKLGIPLYIPSTTDYTTDRLWLSLNGSGSNELTAARLESVFGFRNTLRTVTDATPESDMERWRAAYLRDTWKKQDYFLSAYTREGIGNPPTFVYQPNWMPIIDPDIMGLGDMGYLPDPVVKALWDHRKESTDAFLDSFVKDASIMAKVAVDSQVNMVRVGEDISNHVIEDDKIRLNNGSWVNFNLFARNLAASGTDVVLKSGTDEPALSEPTDDPPMMRYKRILNVESHAAPAGDIIEFTVSEDILHALTAGAAKLQSFNGTVYTTYDTSLSSGADYYMEVVSYSGNVAELEFPNLLPDTPFLDGVLTFVYEVEVPLTVNEVHDPEAQVDELFAADNWEYEYLTPVPSGFTDPLVYTVWTTPSWPGDITAGTDYGKLKQLRQVILAGAGVEPAADYVAVVTDNLRMNLPLFHRMMDLLAINEAYKSAPYTAPKPTTEELYELASIFSQSAKQVYASYWVKEETEYVPSGETAPIVLTLLKSKFAVSMQEPGSGAWDLSLQTECIIDPEFLSRQDIQEGIGQESVFGIYDARKVILDDKTDEYLSWLTPYDANAVEDALNEISTGSTVSGGYEALITPDTLDTLLLKLQSNNPFVVTEAEEKIWDVFGMSPEQYSDMVAIKKAYENPDASLHPTLYEQRKLVAILVTAYKIKQLYPSDSPYVGWIDDELTAGIKYYHVLKMRMAPGRSDFSARGEWQRTLTAWNQYPVVEPDIVGAENVKYFVSGNYVHDEWVSVWDDWYDTGGLMDRIKQNFNSSVTPPTVIRTKFQQLICYSFFNAEWNDPDYADHIVYFNAIHEREEADEDIRPRLAYYGVTITQYRTLKKMYDVIIQPGVINLIESEYEEAWDIFLNIIKQKQEYGPEMLKQFGKGIILSGDDFEEYRPDTTNFPLVNLPDTNERRILPKSRREWFNKLDSRNEIERYNKEWWQGVLAETEDQTMPVMRDGLIRALGRDCEPFDDTAERLAKTLFVETKDNCCVKHTRVSFAIETLQGFVFSLKSGIYDDYLAGYSLSANNFDQEWEWLGSYATWRAAMFTYLYPENLLYPTLKRRQSPAFRKLAQNIQDANRLTPEGACRLAKEYQGYFEDIQNLEIKFTVTAPATSFRNDVNACCADGEQTHFTDFFFAESKISGKRYWSSRPHYEKDIETSYGFWEELPVKDGCSLVGCFPLPLGRNFVDPTFASDNALWLFYTYYDNDKLKFAYIQKNLNKPGSSWSEEIEGAEIPMEITTEEMIKGELKEVVKKFTKVVNVTACQSSIGWDWPSFVVTYGQHRQYTYAVSYRYIDYKAEWEVSEPFDKSNIFYGTGKVLTAIRHESGSGIYALSVVFEKSIHTKYSLTGSISDDYFYDDRIILGAFQSRENPKRIVVLYKKGNHLVKHVIDCSGVRKIVRTDTNITLGYDILQLCPVFSTYLSPVTFALNIRSWMGIGTEIRESPSSPLSLVNPFGLSPTKRLASVSVQSADCIDDFRQRILGVKQHMQDNMGVSSPTPPNYIRTSVAFEYLREAYYYVPMLLALDQQHRGQYESALDWYRTVYDYTIAGNGPNRKVYYGLVQEENLQDVYARPSDWLLDPLNPHLIAQTRANAYTKYTVMNIIQCMLAYADREFTIDTIESVPRARMLYTTALDLLGIKELKLKPNACDELVLCFPNSVSFRGTEWESLFAILQRHLLTLGSYERIDVAKENIIDIFNDSEISTPEQFTEAFEAIEEAKLPYVSQNVSEWVSQSSQMYSAAFQYYAAFPSLMEPLAQVNQQASAGYAAVVSGILQVPDNTLESEASLANMGWLATAQEVTAEYVFSFASEQGQQQFTGANGYNPIAPTGQAWGVNATYTNATTQMDMPAVAGVSFYFPLLDFKYCTPGNPVYRSLELKANLELFKIQNCRNIAGMVRELDVYAAPTDSTTGIPVIGAGGSLILPGLGNYKPSQYRFKVLVERAKQITAQAQQLESLFLSAMEKRDAEYYSQLKARQDLQTSRSTVKLQDLRVRQANNEKVLSELQKNKVEFVQKTYEDWISDGINGYETASLNLMWSVLGLQYAEGAGYGIASGVAAATMSFSDAARYAAQVFGSIATALSTQASIFSQMASYERRRQEWEYQKELAGHDIGIANQQIQISEQNIRIVSQEREISVLQTQHAQDTLEFLQNKFTNAELYNWMSNVLERSYAYMLNLATSVARTAEGQLYFERQEQAGPFILDDYWEPPGDNFTSSGSGTDRRGLTGSARLLQDIYRLDQYAFDTDRRKLQLTKTISLSQNFPVEFQTFKETGVLNFELTNKLFDYDFPGHYLRLVRGVKSTVVGLLPVYGGIKATLTAEPTSYTVIGGTIFQRIPIKRLEVDSVALTSPNASNGLFEMQPVQEEMMNPFEGMGVESRWEFKMPKFSNHVDYDQIADVLITLEYTALDSFQYRYQVLQELDTSLSFNRAFSFRNNFPDQWFDLVNAEAGNTPITVTFQTKKEDFPQGFSDIRAGGRIVLYFVREDGFTEEIDVGGFGYLGMQADSTGRSTVDGKYEAEAVASGLNGGSPYQTWQLVFENKLQNRLLFSEGKVKDILFVITCNGELPVYPL